MNRIVDIYSLLRGNKATFKLVIRLKEMGVNHFLKKITGFNKHAGKQSQRDMQETCIFMEKNQKRIREMLEILEDDKSREVWNAVMECRKEGICVPERLWSDSDQYFVRDIIRLSDDEVFVDGGAFIGDTIQHLINFSKKSGTRIGKVVAFEPDSDNLSGLHRNFGMDSKVKIIEKGLSDGNKILSFSPNGSGGSFVNGNDDDSTVKIPVTGIDIVEECRDATFIKMDIEGAELSALAGGYKTISKNHPKLAVCIYHSLEDMVGIIEYVHRNFPEYRIYVRHHTAGSGETVMYAVV